MKRFGLILLPVLVLLVPIPARAGTIKFDNLQDLEIVTGQYAGLTFSNAIALSSGISLNEFEFPPLSPPSVVSDNGGPMNILFSMPVYSVSGYFTYLTAINMTAYDLSNNIIMTIASQFSSNLAMSGDAGSSPNELLQISFASGISRIVIAGDPAGGSFTLDDLTYATEPQAVPEPSMLSLLLAGGIAIALIPRRLLKH